jgi:hypothetical protein
MIIVVAITSSVLPNRGFVPDSSKSPSFVINKSGGLFLKKEILSLQPSDCRAALRLLP